MTKQEYATNQWLYDNGYQDGVAFVYKKLADEIKDLQERQYEDEEILNHIKSEILLNSLNQ